MFFAALTSPSEMLPQLLHTKRDRLMRLAALTVSQALQRCDVSAVSTTMIRDPGALYYSIVRIIRGYTSSSERLKLACFRITFLTTIFSRHTSGSCRGRLLHSIANRTSLGWRYALPSFASKPLPQQPRRGRRRRALPS
jgi:hypothetical protein